MKTTSYTVAELDQLVEAFGPGATSFLDLSAVRATVLERDALRDRLVSPHRGGAAHATYDVTDDGHGRAMVGGRRLAYGGAGLRLGDSVQLNGPGTPPVALRVGTRLVAELRDGVDFATLVRVLDCERCVGRGTVEMDPPWPELLRCPACEGKGR